VGGGDIARSSLSPRKSVSGVPFGPCCWALLLRDSRNMGERVTCTRAVSRAFVEQHSQSCNDSSTHNSTFSSVEERFLSSGESARSYRQLSIIRDTMQSRESRVEPIMGREWHHKVSHNLDSQRTTCSGVALGAHDAHNSNCADTRGSPTSTVSLPHFWHVA
jgi:hypothetical protein